MILSCPMTLNPVSELMSSLSFSSEPLNLVSNPLLSISTCMPIRHPELHMSNNWTPDRYPAPHPTPNSSFPSLSLFNGKCIHSPVTQLKISDVYLSLLLHVMYQQILSVILQICPDYSCSSPFFTAGTIISPLDYCNYGFISGFNPPLPRPDLSDHRSQGLLLKHKSK